MKCTYTILCMLALARAATAQPTVSELEQRAVDYRRGIRQGELVLTHVSSLKPERDRRTDIWFSGKQIWSDAYLRSQNEDKPHREIQCRGYGGREQYLHWMDMKSSNGAPLGAVISDLTPQAPPGAQAALDPRGIGFIAMPVAFLERERMDLYLQWPERKGTTLTKERWENEDAWRIDFEIVPSGCRLSTWIVPAWGHGVVRTEARDKRHVDTTQTKLAPFGKDRVWFPVSCEYQQYRDGKLVDHEQVQVDVKSLNEPIPDRVFTLEGMNIREGTYVYEPGVLGKVQWKGGKRETVRLREGDPVSPPTPPLYSRPWLVVSMVSAGLAASTQLFYFRRRRTV